VSDLLFCLWIALIGADRIDFAGGHGPFILTPFLALTPIVALSELVRRHTAGSRIEISRGTIAYMAIAGALVSIALLSAFAAPIPTVSFSRTMLLAGDIAGTLTIAILASDRTNLLRLMARGAIAALALFVVFDIAEPLAYLGRIAETARFGPALVKIGELQTAGPIPRLGGAVSDANRAALVLLFYAVVILAGERGRVLRRWALALTALLFIATFSRSGTLGAIGLLALAVIDGRIRVAPWFAASVAMVAALACGAVIARPAVVDRIDAFFTSPAAARLSVSEGSAQGHLALVERGLTASMSSVPRALIGHGYGNSYLELQDVFPANKYGNYHSLYVTMFAEAGIFALLLTLVLLAAPMAAGGFWRPFVAASVCFNFFYQTTTEPVYWFVLALAWASVLIRAHEQTDTRAVLTHVSSAPAALRSRTSG